MSSESASLRMPSEEHPFVVGHGSGTDSPDEYLLDKLSISTSPETEKSVTDLPDLISALPTDEPRSVEETGFTDVERFSASSEDEDAVTTGTPAEIFVQNWPALADKCLSPLLRPKILQRVILLIIWLIVFGLWGCWLVWQEHTLSSQVRVKEAILVLVFLAMFGSGLHIAVVAMFNTAKGLVKAIHIVVMAFIFVSLTITCVLLFQSLPKDDNTAPPEISDGPTSNMPKTPGRPTGNGVTREMGSRKWGHRETGVFRNTHA